MFIKDYVYFFILLVNCQSIPMFKEIESKTSNKTDKNIQIDHIQYKTNEIDVQDAKSNNNILKLTEILRPENHINLRKNTTSNKNDSTIISSPTNSEEDLDTAEAIVYRPLFAYRAKLAKRRRIYESASNYNRRRYDYVDDNRRYGYQSYNRRVYYVPVPFYRTYSYYPSYYPNYYRRAQFPVLT